MRAAPEQTDESLLRCARAGEESAFAALYRRRQAGLYRFALQMSGSESVAEDVTQEVFMSLLAASHGFDAGRGSLSSYLYGAARNQVLRRLEKEKPFVALADETEEAHACGDQVSGARQDPLTELARSETVETVRQAVLALPLHYREVVVLCELQEMSYAEAACALGCAVGTVRSRLHRARALLIERLKSLDEGREPAGDFDAARCFA
ncbi:MAG: RNA polymerase sigma factor [Acidobacteria bacterium]|nr:RNA polymerase sigma factor [Acidobacteriota bacterium]MCA1641624.1 RNA polymerase sigma factor [Acidobacteriota bacterium]